MYQMKKMHHSHKSLCFDNKHGIVLGWDYKFCGLVQNLSTKHNPKMIGSQNFKMSLQMWTLHEANVWTPWSFWRWWLIPIFTSRWRHWQNDYLVLSEIQRRFAPWIDMSLMALKVGGPKTSTFIVSISHYPRKVLSSPKYCCYYGSEGVISS